MNCCHLLSQGKEQIADKKRVELSKGSKSDHIMLVNAYKVRNLPGVYFMHKSNNDYINFIHDVSIYRPKNYM